MPNAVCSSRVLLANSSYWPVQVPLLCLLSFSCTLSITATDGLGLAHCLLLGFAPESMRVCHLQGRIGLEKGLQSCCLVPQNVILCFWLFLKQPAVDMGKRTCFLFFSATILLSCKFDLIKRSKAVYIFWYRGFFIISIWKKRTHVFIMILIWILLVPYYRFW